MPYNCDPGESEFPEYARIAIEAPARMMETCIQAKKVRSLAKKTLGSTLMGAFRCFTIVGLLGEMTFSTEFLRNKLEKIPTLFFSLLVVTT